MTERKKPTLKLLGGRTLSSQIVAQIRDALFRGEYKSGEPIGSEAELAQDFGVSRMSVRDALRTLEAMGVIEVRVGFGGGTRIAEGSTHHFTEALSVQLALLNVPNTQVLQAQAAIEIAAAGLAALHASDEDIERMRNSIIEAKKVTSDPLEVAKHGQEFHQALAASSGNLILAAQLEGLKHVMWPPQSSRTSEKVGAKVVKIHSEILDAVAARDASLARKLMANHVATLLRKAPNSTLSEAEISACCDV